MIEQYMDAPDFLLEKVYAANDINRDSFTGKILLLGLGTAFLLRKYKQISDNFTVVEIDQYVIDTVNQRYPNNNWKIIKDDANTFTPDEKYDTILVDIWLTKHEDQLILQVIERYKQFLRPNGQVLYLKTILSSTPAIYN